MRNDFVLTRLADEDSVAARFERIAAAFCHDVAVVHETGQMSYRTLRLAALGFACHCRTRGVKAGDLVAVDARRSWEIVACIMGLAYLGAVYVPVALEDPATGALFDQHSIRFIATIRSGLDVLQGKEVLVLPYNWEESEKTIQLPAISRDAPLYVLFTSGSTGDRKGVVVPQRGVLRLVQPQEAFAFGPRHRTLLHSPLTFDASTFELWGPLLTGGSLMIAPDRPLSFDDFGEIVRRDGVSTLWMTSGLFHAAAREHQQIFDTLQQLLVGGDVIHPGLFRAVKRSFPRLRLVNGYGPTENTVFTCCYAGVADDGEDSLPIGRPIHGTTIRIVGSDGEDVDEGQPGELIVSGDGVALGYLHDPELTARRFSSQKSGTTVWSSYRTNDLVRRDADGNLLFLGRLDSEVKLLGQRVQLDDVTQAIKQVQGVRDCVPVVVELGEGDKKLVAFIVWDGPDREAELRRALSSTLMPAALPNIFIAMPDLPLNDNGKIDREQLKQVAFESLQQAVVLTNDSLPEQIQTVWSMVLGHPVSDEHAPFFELGGDSLSLLRMHAELRKLSGYAPALPELFSLPTIAKITEYIQKREVMSAHAVRQPVTASMKQFGGAA
ncbi:non-ribosomal peptide synthetase [Terriglobus roseus]|uniref:Amino acid adenylation domain-containing protein n=1 Tax=Terriglobus roseus TaxID=392734 RepID=A0A1H4SIA4_9BACT|nr:non-ribosomal peptide synthetase [Terriglobus roseus]SEC43889.1 amino acid adenylation domain-containing protein [Terriglobus roseus]